VIAVVSMVRCGTNLIASQLGLSAEPFSSSYDRGDGFKLKNGFASVVQEYRHQDLIDDILENPGRVRLIWLSRVDIFAQAVSLEVAERSGVWRRIRRQDPMPKFAKVDGLSRMTVDNIKTSIDLYVEAFKRFASVTSITTTYERMTGRNRCTMRTLSRFTGLKARLPGTLPTHGTMADPERLIEGGHEARLQFEAEAVSWENYEFLRAIQTRVAKS
jgi:hypothetical protein